MKFPFRFLLATGWLAAVAIPAHAKIERVVEKTFTVQPGGNLHVETQGGNVSVEPSNDSVVKNHREGKNPRWHRQPRPTRF